MKEHIIPGDPDKGKAILIEIINQKKELKKYVDYFDTFKDRGFDFVGNGDINFEKQIRSLIMNFPPARYRGYYIIRDKSNDF
jgi:hypothetical protein